MKGARGREHARGGLSSIYGFIMIYLLAVASLQAIATSVSSSEAAQSAALHAGQVTQTKSLEHLRVTLSSGVNVTITNDGLISSSLAMLLARNATLSRALPLQQRSLAVGATTTVSTRPSGSSSSSSSFPSSVAVVTTLGNVFASSSSNAPSPGGNWKTLQGLIGGPGIDAQLYQNPADATRFFFSSGTSVSAFSTARGTQLWSFDAGEGIVTDVLPLSDGGVYVSDGYYGDQFSSRLYRLTSSGTSVWQYSMRLLRLYTTLEVQYPDNDQPPAPMGSQPVQKGADSLYAYYDGWFFSSSGPSPTSVPSDSFNFAAADNGQFYLFSAAADPGGGCTQPRGNVVNLFAYSANGQGVQSQWFSTLFVNVCDLYPTELIASATGSGLVASLFAVSYWSQPNYFGGPYRGSNPFLAVLSSSTGSILRSGTLDSNGYTSVATDGARLFLSIPSLDEVEVLSASGGGTGSFYKIGIPASKLIWYGGSLFALSQSQVKVYDSSMNLRKSIDFAQNFYSLSNSKPLEPQMIQPSFLVLNSTTYVALLRNSTGYGSLVLGAYSP